MTTQQQIEIAVGLAQSTPPPVAQVGIRYLRAKLPELEASGAGQLPADTLFAVLHVLKTNPEFLSNVPQAEILIKSLLKVGGWWVGAMPVCV